MMKEKTVKSKKYILRRIYLLLWKNLLFRRRHYVVTAFEVILPTILAMLMAFLRTQLDEGTYKLVDRVSVFPPTTQQVRSRRSRGSGIWNWGFWLKAVKDRRTRT
jgi:hypothetical protein